VGIESLFESNYRPVDVGIHKIVGARKFIGVCNPHKNIQINFLYQAVNCLVTGTELSPHKNFELGFLSAEPPYGNGTPDVLLGYINSDTAETLSINNLIVRKSKIFSYLNDGKLNEKDVIFESCEVKTLLMNNLPPNSLIDFYPLLKEDFEKKQERYEAEGVDCLFSICLREHFEPYLNVFQEFVDRAFILKHVHTFIPRKTSYMTGRDVRTARKKKKRNKLDKYDEELLKRADMKRNNNLKTVKNNLHNALQLNSNTSIRVVNL
jgi:hypothetical protein